METLVERFDAVQEKLLGLYEAGRSDLESQIQHWDLVRQEHVLLNYARRQGIQTLGLQKVPPLAASESKAKTAIMMQLVLKSLKKSQYGQEPWTLTDTSHELFTTAPENTFKKGGVTVEVLFDNEEEKAMPYTLWRLIYYQDADELWHKTHGQVDADGLYFIDMVKQKHYYVHFTKEAVKYGQKGMWQVRTGTDVLFGPSSIASTSTGAEQGDTTAQVTRSARKGKRRRHSRRQTPSTTSTTTETDSEDSASEYRRRKRRHRERKRSKHRWDTGSESSTDTAAAVGSRHRSPDRNYPSRLARLQAEAWDPPILLVKGPSNTLKCWRYRCRIKYRGLFQCISTAFTWVADAGPQLGNARIIVGFTNTSQREKFIQTVKLPKGTSSALGNLDSF
ncbi:E2 protein [human papillomavirus 103]|uniref:Regulatory protein E2 n=1 Tax=human papillomavirus 103 TaxID=338323 RepID=Q1AHT4_9PAPI|nr:E2 protein [human papillomavirus 103]AAZ39487.1 E2 protein [human papillomavirus 103]